MDWKRFFNFSLIDQSIDPKFLIDAMEKRFSITIPQDDPLPELTTLGDLNSLLWRLICARPQGAEEWNESSVFTELKHLVSETEDVAEATLNKDTRLVEDLGF